MKKITLLFAGLLLAFCGLAQTKNTPDVTRVFSVNELLQDFDSLHTWIKATHPNLYLEVSEEQAEKRWKKVRASVKRPMTRNQFLLLAAPLTTQYRDGHTGLYLDAEAEEGQAYDQSGGKFFPVQVKVKNGKLYAVNSYNASLLKPGARITKLNGVKAEKLVAEFSRYWYADHATNLESNLSRFFNTTLWFARGWGNEVTIEFVNYGSTKKQSEILLGAPYAQVATYIYPGNKPHQLKLYEPESLAILEFTGFSNSKATDHFLDSVFTILKEKDIQHLAVDIRRNGGGNSVVGDKILHYLTTKPYQQGIAKELKYSAAVPNLALNKWFKSYLDRYEGKFVNNLYKMEFEPTKREPLQTQELFYTGNFYLLTSPRTFSSGHMMAAAVKAYNLGTIVGEETGNKMNFFGEVMSFQLPNTQLWGMCSGAQWWSAGISEANKLKGVQPDVYVPQTIKHIAEVRDAVLEHLKSKVTRTASNTKL